jgi:hypothetical protein
VRKNKNLPFIIFIPNRVKYLISSKTQVKGHDEMKNEAACIGT